MLSIIKTAVITIIISFISGVLLDTYKNLAPRIVCSIGKGIPIRLGNKKIRAYTLTVRNISNKTIHDLTLNVQGHYDNLKVDDAKITRGLKFDVSNEDNIYCVNIPFLSKDDEFSVKLFVEKIEGIYKKPGVTLRSPENFKKIESDDQNGFVASLLNVPENIGGIFKRRSMDSKQMYNKSKSSFGNKKVVATIVSIILIIFIAVFGVQHYLDRTKKINNEVKTNSSQNIDNSNTSSPSSNSSKNNTTNKQVTQKNNDTSNNSSSEATKGNKSSEGKSTTSDSSNDSKQASDKSKSQSEEGASNNESESNSGTEEQSKNKSIDSSSVNSESSKDEAKDSAESKAKQNIETKTQSQEEKESGSESGGTTTTNPSESKTN